MKYLEHVGWHSGTVEGCELISSDSAPVVLQSTFREFRYGRLEVRLHIFQFMNLLWVRLCFFSHFHVDILNWN